MSAHRMYTSHTASYHTVCLKHSLCALVDLGIAVCRNKDVNTPDTRTRGADNPERGKEGLVSAKLVLPRA